MSKWARQRDANEAPIVEALRRAGASVTKIDSRGAPDLLVGFEGRTYLIEVKQDHGKPGKGMAKTASGLRETQEKWWSEWFGAPPQIATTIPEALAVIGAAS